MGNVKSLKKQIILKPSKDKRGYLIVGLYKEQKSLTKRIHKLVALTFIPNPERKPQVNHINGNKLDNRESNLEWVTSQENINHSWKNGLSTVTKNMREHCKAYNKKVVQYDKNNNFIKEWESASEAGRKLGIFQQCIVACLKNRTRTAGGFVWKYKVEKENKDE